MSYEYADGCKIRDQFGLHFMTFTVVGWIDLFSRKAYRDILIKNMQHCRKHKQLAIGCYVIMTNHVHVIWQSKNGKLSDTLRDFKSYSTKEFIAKIKTEEESRRDWLMHMFNTMLSEQIKIKSSKYGQEIIIRKKYFRSSL